MNQRLTALVLCGFLAAPSLSFAAAASLALLAACTPPKDMTLQPVELPVGGWEVTRFSKSQIAWVSSTAGEAAKAISGLFGSDAAPAEAKAAAEKPAAQREARKDEGHRHQRDETRSRGQRGRRDDNRSNRNDDWTKNQAQTLKHFATP